MANPMPTDFAILFVDDEEQALKYFEKAFADEFPILTAPSVEQATKILEQEGERIGVLITDQRMPGQQGTDLLAVARESYPHIVRMLTTAFADLDSAIDAVNDGAVFRYITKPWDLRELRGILHQAMDYFTIQRERDVLLREKLGVLQRMIVMDRIRSFTIMAASMASSIRHSLTALKAFLELAPVSINESSKGGPVEWDDLWSLARSESHRILETVESVLSTTVETEHRFDQDVILEDMWTQAIDGRSQFKLAASHDIQVKGNDSMLTRLAKILIDQLADLTEGDQTVGVNIESTSDVQGAPGVIVRCTINGAEWSPQHLQSLFSLTKPDDLASGARVDVLSAFFIAHHHGGQLLVHVAPPHGPGLELRLPLDPTAIDRPDIDSSWLDRVFTNLEYWE